MKQFTRKLLCAGLGFWLGMSVVSAQAIGWPVFDVVRTVEFAGQGVQRLLALISEYQKVHSKEEELKNWETKKKIDPQEELPKAIVYEYVSGAKPMEMGSHEYLKALEGGEVRTADSIEKEIRQKFFLPADIADKRVSEEERQTVDLRRREYMEALSREILSLSQGVQNAAQSELGRLYKASIPDGNKPMEAGSNIQQIDLLVQTKKTMLEQKGADIVLQAKIMELEALKMLTGMDTFLVPNPDENK